jgi:16S rRNA (uracil1498-N3)-methyltransferase
MPRFYCPIPLSIGNYVDLPEKVAHHIQVLRLQIGEEITLFNGEGGEFTAEISQLAKKQAHVCITAHHQREAEPPHAITLAQALPEGSKMDWILEKATELGATYIQPLAAQRCVVKLNAERAEKKHSHWEAILIAAAEQSGRNRIPQLAPTTSFKDWITKKSDQPRILLSPRATESLAQWSQSHPHQAVTVMIGPEGGFSPEEEQLAIDQGAIALSMGPRILRTETAGLAVLAILTQHHS